ncbi:MAG: CpaF family protein, partial [Deltaproteobacteria bacterium]|nr:CpaF family protein [Deltaproteobacteria bacterium]
MKLNAKNNMHTGAKKYLPDEYFELKAKIHDRLLDIIDLSLIDKLDRDALRSNIRELAEKIMSEDQGYLPLNLA